MGQNQTTRSRNFAHPAIWAWLKTEARRGPTAGLGTHVSTGRSGHPFWNSGFLGQSQWVSSLEGAFSFFMKRAQMEGEASPGAGVGMAWQSFVFLLWMGRLQNVVGLG